MDLITDGFNHGLMGIKYMIRYQTNRMSLVEWFDNGPLEIGDTSGMKGSMV